MTRAAAFCTLIGAVLLPGASVGQSDPCAVFFDGVLDHAPRPTDPGNVGAFAGAEALIDLLEITVGQWDPDDPADDLFVGGFSNGGKFLRVDVRVAGLKNPPGKTLPGPFDPYAFGPYPIYGFIELDIDEDEETGGEIAAPQFRYVGAVARFGGLPNVPRFENRIARKRGDLDGDFMSAPFVERSGEEFHVALLGDQFSAADITVVNGDTDLIFEVGETWHVVGRWLHRAHGYSMFTVSGDYEPEVPAQFEHDPAADETTISIVFPLNNVGASQMLGGPPEPYNFDPTDHFSIHEALRELHLIAEQLDQNPTGLPEEAIIIEWSDRDPAAFLDPEDWRVCAILGTSYTSAVLAEHFVWSDVYPNVVRADVNGDGVGDAQDQGLIDQYIAAHDGDDGLIDGRVTLSGFADDFRVFDANYSGVIDASDPLFVLPAGDASGDGDVDLEDLAELQACYSGAATPLAPECVLLDLDADGNVDFQDVVRFWSLVAGPLAGGQE